MFFVCGFGFEKENFKREKKGEVVEPAGGETGVPRCLAEDCKLPPAVLFLYKQGNCFKLTLFAGRVKQKTAKATILKGSITPALMP